MTEGETGEQLVRLQLASVQLVSVQMARVQLVRVQLASVQLVSVQLARVQAGEGAGWRVSIQLVRVQLVRVQLVSVQQQFFGTLREVCCRTSAGKLTIILQEPTRSRSWARMVSWRDEVSP